MQWKFWRGSGPKGIPEKVEQALASRFCLKAEEIGQLRMLDQWGRLAALTGVVAEDRRVRFIRIFDPSSIQKEQWATLTYNYLKTAAGRKALRFEGHIERDGSVHLADRRPPRSILKPVNLHPPGAATAPTNWRAPSRRLRIPIRRPPGSP